ncbi:ribonuclease R [Haloferula sargassicola]|uniref:Ribonuclease R n=1 Tax=Haloferula sargassicola TaxID=490096 RepID=A0ABP9UTZ1_9BACT
MSRIPLRDRLLEILRSPGARPMNKSEFVRALDLPASARPMLRKELAALEQQGKITATKKGRYEISSSKPDQLRGSIKFMPKGNAWFFPDAGDPDNLATDHDLEELSRIHVPRHATGTALDGDRVLVSVSRPKQNARDFRRGRRNDSDAEPEAHAKVEKVLNRRSGKLVGIYRQKNRMAWIESDDAAISGNIELIGDTTARPGQMVVARVEQWQHQTPHARIIEVLGWPDEAGVDILAIIHKNGIRTSFPDEVLEEARNFGDSVDAAEIKNREDWRDRLVITIDPADAKDHDDAIWVSKTDNGWQLAVHIADVSHYVKPRTPLDKEAIERGNSTYLVDRVIPMLPVELSNGLCSLKPDVDRFTKCAVMDVNRQGKVIKSRFCNAVIHSQAKLSYEQAQEILDGGKAPKGSIKGLAEMVKEAWAMASKMRQRRFAVGALDLEMPEIRVRLDDEGNATKIENVVHTESHQLIEECMLAANESVARILKIRNKPTIYRIHEDPDTGRLLEYGETAKAFGYNFGDLTNKDHIQKLLDAAKGNPDEHAIKIGLLKSLKRAAYSPDPLGHYGLSKADYCHFTSPIRRYADLVVHRSLQPFLDNPPKQPDKTPRQTELHEIARHISDTERASADAENESKNIKLLEYLDHTTQLDEPVIFDGLITEVRPMGLMVEATDISTRGVVKREDLGQGWRVDARYDRAEHRDGRRLLMGQRIKLQVARIDHERKFVDFRLVDDGNAGSPPLSQQDGKKPRRSSSKKPARSRSNSVREPAIAGKAGKPGKAKNSGKSRSSKRPKKIAHKRRRK